MRGSPLLEWAIVAMVALVCFIPMKRLTQSVSLPLSHAHSHSVTPKVAEVKVEEAWLEIKCSHVPEQIEIYQNETLLWEGGGACDLDAEFAVQISEGRNELVFVFRWSEEVEQAYVDMEIEVASHPLLSWGGWSSGEDTRSWFLEWEASL
ncbi:hypothetical protein P3T73_00830 [Kiritimatiellota bacterium B12222]|nr:hypothetical protein P3T73_00830 [Kiritimatiellota bacterium B12222]